MTQTIEELQDQHERQVRDRDEKVAEADLATASRMVSEELVSRVSTQDIEGLTDLLNEGVAAIFHDRPDYRIEIVVDRSRGNQTVDFMLHSVEGGHAVVSDIRSETGGGVKAVVGLLIQVFFVQFNDTGMARLILQDEGLSAVSAEYLPALGEFLGMLRDEMGFVFLFDFHDPRMMDWADRKYVVDSGEFELQD